jgi:hypothetical protein
MFSAQISDISHPECAYRRMLPPELSKSLTFFSEATVEVHFHKKAEMVRCPSVKYQGATVACSRRGPEGVWAATLSSAAMKISNCWDQLVLQNGSGFIMCWSNFGFVCFQRFTRHTEADPPPGALIWEAEVNVTWTYPLWLSPEDVGRLH